MAAVLTLARNLLVARLIPVADYGVAATLALAMAVVEMATALGLQQQIVQAREGDDPRFQAALQGFQLLRGLVAGAALVAIAWPLASFLRVPEAAWGYAALGAVPVLNALQHFDIHRLNRRMSYGPLVLTSTLPVLAAFLAVWPLAALFGDWRVMLVSILIQAGLAVVVSHLVAERRFWLVLDPALMARATRFGWPLLLNGVLLFLVLQGDKLMVGRVLGMEPLAIFAMGVTLTLTPTLVMDRTVQNLFLPRLSRADPAGPDFAPLARAALQAALLNGAILVAAVVLVAAPFVALALGAKYAPLIPLLVPLAVLHAVRVWKTGAAVVALARGQTGNAMAANLPRVVALPLAWWLLQEGGTLLQLVWLGTAAEAVGLCVALALVRRRSGLRLGPHLPALAAGILLLAVASLADHLATATGGLPGWGAALAVVALLALLVALSRDLLGLLARLRRGGGKPPRPPQSPAATP